MVTGFATKKMHMAAYDVGLSPAHDITTPAGFCIAVELVLRVKEGGMIHLAPPCSTFVWVNRGTSGRSRERPEGRTQIKGVALANLIAVRCVLLVLLAMARKVHWILEQPSSSVMALQPRFKELFAKHKIITTFTWMGMFGGETPKATVLYSSSPWTSHLKKVLNRQLFSTDATPKTVKEYTDKNGLQRATRHESLQQ